MVDSLRLVDLVDANDKAIDGLVSVHDPSSAETPHEYAILLQVATFEHVHYVFFRRFKDPEGRHVRTSQVLAYVVDNSQRHLTEDDLARLHHKLWLHGVAPLIYVAWPTRIDILSCARRPDFWHASAEKGVTRYHCADRIESPADGLAPSEAGQQAIKTAAKIATEFNRLRQRFSAYRLAEGTFWDDPDNQKLAKNNAAAHRSLIQAIVEVDRELDGANKPLRRRLLVLMVLIKYLEDRDVFPPGHFGRFHAGARSFRDMLREGTVDEVLRLLRYFENKFNGDVFSLGDDAEKLTKRELERFARLVEAKELGGQKYFWELFSFEHIPVEVISRLYQRFVTGHGAVYTPQFLASLLLDQVMPYDRMTGTEKVLDPACGSGIFLVGAFKRLVIHWRSRHQWRKPSVDDLKRILAHSIHGVELEAGAIDLAAFSLALAICDALTPPVIWSSLKLDKLRGRNLREGDFFDPETFANGGGHKWPEKFDVVIGNPPFESELTPAAKAVDKVRSKHRPNLPDKQAAYLFLEQGLQSLVPGGSLCLIQPHGLLYNSNPADFRRHLMRLCRLHTVLDFVSMRGLYDGADPKTIAWNAVQGSPTDEPINHLTFRRTYSAAERIAFEIDHYDWQIVLQRQAMEDPFVWRAGLLGGGRLYELSARFQNMRTLSEYARTMNWEYGEGYISALAGRRTPAAFLTGMDFLPSHAFTEKGIDETAITHVNETSFRSAYTELRFTAPLLLIKKHETLPFVLRKSGNLAYKAQIVGVHPTRDTNQEFEWFVKFFQRHHGELRFALCLNGTRGLAAKATAIEKQDIDSLPIPVNESDLEFSFWEDALKTDVLVQMAAYVRLGQDSDLLAKSAGTNELHEFSSLYVRMLGSLYRNLNAHEPIFLNGLIAQPFYFGTRPDVSWLGRDCEESLRRLIYDESRESLRTVRVVRYYEGNVILIVKPDRLRYWIRSTAIRDADDTLIDLREQGW
ncbi:MAG: N-6 DNA methylase [Planctomycetes bacterium]|nr:N-6 DNA methylase [Planctomycetota bacterium]